MRHMALASVPAAPKGCGGVIAIGVVERFVFTRGLLTTELDFVNQEPKRALTTFSGSGTVPEQSNSPFGPIMHHPLRHNSTSSRVNPATVATAVAAATVCMCPSMAP